MDIDIIFYGCLEISEPDLVIPHERFAERLFVLEPVLEAAPDFVLPGGAVFSDYYASIKNKLRDPLQKITRLT